MIQLRHVPGQTEKHHGMLQSGWPVPQRDIIIRNDSFFGDKTTDKKTQRKGFDSLQRQEIRLVYSVHTHTSYLTATVDSPME